MHEQQRQQVVSENGTDYDHYARVVDDLNNSFHHHYRQAIERSHAQLGRRETPVIVVSGDHVTLFYDGREETSLIIPSLYQEVKSISHLSFGVYVMLSNSGYGPLSGQLRSDLANQLALIEEGLSVLDNLAIPAPFVSLQRRTLTTAEAVVREVLQAGAIDEARVKAFGDVSAPLYLENAGLAARLELDALHEVIGRWQKQVGEADWANVYVVICAAHQARYRETTKQYFQRLLHEKELPGANYENRVIYAEHIHDNDSALSLLARHVVDQKTSLSIFGDRTRLQEDLMSDGAAAYLQTLLAG